MDNPFDLSDVFDQTVTVFPPANKLKKKIFPLLRLPAELRLMIYEPLVHAGDLSILRVSKLISREAVPLLSKVAVLRVHLGRHIFNCVTLPLTAKVTLSGSLTFSAPDYIQYLELRIELTALNRFTEDRYAINANLIHCFSGTQVSRKMCKITIGYGQYGPIPRRPELNDVYRGLSALTGFKVLKLRLVYHSDANWEEYMRRKYGIPPLDGGYGLSHKMVVMDYRQVFQFLSKTLGDAQFQDSASAHYLEFRPSAYRVRGRA